MLERKWVRKCACTFSKLTKLVYTEIKESEERHETKPYEKNLREIPMLKCMHVRACVCVYVCVCVFASEEWHM